MINLKSVSTKNLILCSLFFLYGISELKADDFEKQVVVFKMPDASPVQITQHEFSATPDYIIHEVTAKNTSDKLIDYVEFGFADFDVFKNHIEIRYQFCIGTFGPDTALKWDCRASKLDGYQRFEITGTSFGFVSRVRFNDGTVWRFDKAGVDALIKKIETRDALTLDDFKKEKSD